MSLRVFFLVFDEDVASAKEDLRALGRGDEAPGGEGLLCGGDGVGDVFGVGGREAADDVGVVGGVQVEDGFAAAGGDPLAADEVVGTWDKS